ncbi:MAG: radical SAM protein [Candidatus Lokiarchaeota archaeon]|nr:radical SAM protein [Candidatus Lokiarchaeota archaeon]
MNGRELARIPLQIVDFMGNFAKMGIANIPVAVNFDITYNCNLRCEHCYYWASIAALGIKKWELSDEQWLDVFKYYQKLGVRNVSLTGGEPTLRMNIIKEAHKYFPQVQTATNGIIRIPKRVQPRGIWLSIDGPQDVHNKIRGSNTCFQKLVANYQDDTRVSVSSTISTTNYKHIDDIVKIVEDMNVNGVFFMLYSGSKDSPLLPTGKVYAKVMADLARVAREHPNTVLVTNDMLQAYHNKDFIKTCPFLNHKKRASVFSFYADMTRKRCVMGDNVDCSTCSCIVPVGTYVLQHNTANLENYRKIMTILGL